MAKNPRHLAIVNGFGPLLFAFACVATCSAKDTQMRVKMATMSVHELFDIGGKPIGIAEGNGLPVSELKRRDETTVVNMAIARLRSQSKHEYDHAFAVYCLRRISPQNLSDTLFKLYPRVDGYGRYEILLYAIQKDLKTFRPYFVEILNAKNDSLDNADIYILAAKFAHQFPSTDFVPGLKRFQAQLKKEFTPRKMRVGFSDSIILDGFPYSDIVTMTVESPTQFVDKVIEKSRNSASEE